MEEAKGGFTMKYVITGLCFSLLSLGIVDHIWNIDKNSCEMTYMWEAPQYNEIDLSAQLKSSFPHYNLFSYGEGSFAAKLAAGQYSGQPVLFIPGNGGSYKQVRSLASVAHRKSLEDSDIGKSAPHFEFFSADLAEELGALYGPALEEQTKFVSEMIRVIKSLYPPSEQNKPVILIGHSMVSRKYTIANMTQELIGGMVARAVMVHNEDLRSSVPLILTLATPHAAPPLALDSSISNFYDKVNSFWLLEKQSGGLSEVLLVSVGGGRNDLLVSSFAIQSQSSDLTTSTTAVPGCWLSTDHLSIVWCKQFVLATVRALYDSMDRNSNRITTNKKKLQSVFDYHLISRFAGKKHISHRKLQEKKITPTADAKWTEYKKRQGTIEQPKHSKQAYVMISIKGTPLSEYQSATIHITGLDSKQWIFACSATSETDANKKISEWNLSKNTNLLGGVGKKRSKMVEVLLTPLLEESNTHLVIALPPSDHTVTIHYDIHGSESRKATVDVPMLVLSFKPTEAIERTPKNAIIQHLQLKGQNEPWQSYDLILKPSANCPINGTAPPIVRSLMHTSNQLPHVNRRIDGTNHIYTIEQNEIAVTSGTKVDVSVEMILQPECAYNVAVKGNMSGAFRRIFMLYGPQIPAFIICQLLLGLAIQLKGVAASRHCPSLLTAILTTTPVLVVPFVKLAAMVLFKMGIRNDQQVISDMGIDLPLLPILLFFCCLPITLILSGAIWLVVLGAGNAMYSTALRLFGATTGVSEVVADLALTGLAKIPIIVAVSLLAVAYGSCGALALWLATFYYFIQLFDMYKDHIKKVILILIPRLQDETPPEPETPVTQTPETEANSEATEQQTAEPATNAGVVVERTVVPQSSESLSLHLHLTLLILCLAVSLLFTPNLIAWAIHTKRGSALPFDPSMVPSILLLISLSVLWQVNPNHSRMHYKPLGFAIHTLAVCTLLFASINIFYLPYIVATGFLLVAAHQIFAPELE